jgi:hypothetical protein
MKELEQYIVVEFGNKLLTFENVGLKTTPPAVYPQRE